MRIFEGVTIDPPGSEDLDDAIWVERHSDGWTLSVAFPRLVDLVPFAEAADAAAFTNGFTRYRGSSMARPMLPMATSRRGSLTPDGDKDAFLVEVRLGADLEPEPAVVSRVVSRTVSRLTYPAADALAKSGRGGRVAAMLAEANALARLLSAKRLSSGSIGFADVGGDGVTDEEGRLVQAPWSRHWANAVVREAMVLANASLAALCAAAGLPILYRNHRVSAVASRDAILGDIGLARTGALGLEALFGRLALVIGPATLGPRVEGHWGLNLPAYAWFTSPLRRYADLVNQRVLEAHLLGEPSPYDVLVLERMGSALDALNLAERQARSDGFREAVTRKAEGAITWGSLRAVPSERFGPVVKAATLGGMMTDEVADEVRARLAAGTLTSKECARLLLHGGGVVARDVVARLLAHPHEAVNVANYGVQALGWAAPAYEEQTSPNPRGVGHVFSCVASLTVDGATHVSPRCVAGTIKEARQEAAARAIAALAAVPLPSPALDPVEAPVVVQRKAPVADASARNRLQEWCQARRVDVPAFEVESSGPSHAPTFSAVARVSVRGTERSSPPCHGVTRKGAEAAAAQALLESLVSRAAGGAGTSPSTGVQPRKAG